MKRYELFMALSDTIKKAYAEDIGDYLADVRDNAPVSMLPELLSPHAKRPAGGGTP